MQVAVEEIEQGVVSQDEHEDSGLVIHDRSVEFTPNITYDTAVSVLQRWILVEERMPFYIGDMILFIANEYGTTYEEIAGLCGFSSTQTVKDRASVSYRVPAKNRTFDVSYSCYRYVAPLSHEEQVKWLAMAQNERIGASTLLSMIHESQGKIKPIHALSKGEGKEYLPSLTSADGGNDYLVDRQDGAKSSHGNYSQNGHEPLDYRESDLSYAIGHKADELGRESDLEDDIEALRQERDRAVMEWQDMRHTIASLQEEVNSLQKELESQFASNKFLSTSLWDARETATNLYVLQENHRKAVLRLGSEKEQLQANLEAIGGNLYQVLESNHLAYDLYLLDALKRDGLIDNSQYDNLKALRNDASFDEEVKETIYVDEEF